MIARFFRSIIVSLAFIPFCSFAQDTTSYDVAESSQSQAEDLKQGTALGAAQIAEARPINKLALELIKASEGWIPHHYDDPSQYCTIGYGHLIALEPCKTLDLEKLGFDGELSESTGEALLFQDTTSARVAVSISVTANLTQNQFGAIVSLVFNIGKGNFKKSTLLVLNANAFDLVPAELRRWSSSKGVILKGLLRRRLCEGNLFNNTLHIDNKGHVDLDSCGAQGVAADVTNPIDVIEGEQK
jgi:lysozyme